MTLPHRPYVNRPQDERAARDAIHEYAPAPWHVGERPSPRSMWPIRAANDKVVAYARTRAVADLIASLHPADPAT
jgi:hypothetical protein